MNAAGGHSDQARFGAVLRLVIYLVAQLAALALVVGIGASVKKTLNVDSNSVAGIIASSLILLASFAVVLLVTWAALRNLNRLPLSTLGLTATGRWRRESLVGLGIGALCPLLIAAQGLAFNTAHFSWRAAPWALFSLALTKTLLIALFEESLFRGYFFQEIERWKGKVVAMAATFCIFGGLHLLNKGGSLQGLISTGLAGAALYYTFTATRRLWMAIGFHFTWNATLSLVLGFSNGGDFFPGRLMDATIQGPAIISGGTFGPEASIWAWLSVVGIAVVSWAVADRHQTSARGAS